MEAPAHLGIRKPFKTSAVAGDVRGVQDESIMTEEADLEGSHGNREAGERMLADEDSSKDEHGVGRLVGVQAVVAGLIEVKDLHSTMVGGRDERAQSDN